MQPMEVVREIGRLETGVWAAHRRMDDQRREYMGHIALLHKRTKNGNGHGGRSKQWATMALIAIVSLLGLLKPELAVMLLRVMAH